MRSCGRCSLCCKLYAIEELSKPVDVWCQHCRPGKVGCSIYQDRPQGCVDFACSWLGSDFGLDDEWWPQRSKIVVRTFLGSKHNLPTMEFRVDPSYPNRWREEPYYSKIKELSVFGLSLLQPDTLTVLVVVGEAMFYVFPTRIIERRQVADEEERKRLATEFDLAMDEWKRFRIGVTD